MKLIIVQRYWVGMRNWLLALTLVLVPTLVKAAATENVLTFVHSPTPGLGEYLIGDPGHGFWFNAYESGNQIVIQPTEYLVGGRHDWFQVSEFDLIDSEFVTTHLPFISNMGIATPAYFDANETIYFAYWFPDFDGVPRSTDIYGWAALSYDGDSLTLISDAQGGPGEGIYAGTTETVPEPTLITLFALGAGMVALGTRRRNRQT